jgi:aerobic carbon-monoxide dehydrogenase medium subunit
MPSDPAFVAPATVPQALAALRAEGALAVAGGTSIGLLLGQSLIEPSVLVWLGRIPSLREMGFDGADLRVGAAVTLLELSRHPDVRSSLQALAEAAGTVGNARVRALATVGGALAHADPRQDLPAALVALGAIAEITVIPRQHSVYLRFTPGSVADYPTVAAAACASRNPDGTLGSVALSLAGVDRTVLTVPESASLVGQRAPSEASLAAVADAAASRAQPVADRLGSVAYKRAMAAVWARRALAACLAHHPPSAC